MTQQSGSSDCGQFAVAFITHLAHGLNPCHYKIKQSVMRKHFLKCIDQEKMLPSPTISQRSSRLPGTKETVKVQLYCYRRLPDDGLRMIAVGHVNWEAGFTSSVSMLQK